MMKKIILFSFIACFVTACQTMNSVRSSFSNSISSVSNLFADAKSESTITECPAFTVSEELNRYYEIPASSNQDETIGFSNAVIADISGACRMNEEEDIVSVSLDINFKAYPGPFAAQDTTAITLEVPYFIAVIDEEQEILAKDTFYIPFEFTGSETNIRHDERLQQNIPVAAGKSPSGYTIITGFQLNETQLAYAKNRKISMPAIAPAAGEESEALEASFYADPFAGQ